MKPVYAGWAIAMGCVLAISVRAEESIVHGYALITPEATEVQKDVLSVVITLKFPDTVQTVGEAIQFLLERSGYRLASGVFADPWMPTLMHLPLPQAHRALGPIHLRNALQILAGDTWYLVEDPVNRLVSFDLNPRFRDSEIGRPKT